MIKHPLLRWSARALAYVPFRFAACQLLGHSYYLRCVLFHHIADQQSPFTEGLGVTVTRKEFEDGIRFLTRYYTPVSLQEALSFSRGGPAPRRPVLVTFDDAYASVASEAAPICEKYGVPAVFFVNAFFVGNQELALDNLVCYVANVFGFSPINAAAKAISQACLALHSLAQIFQDFLPRLSILDRERFGREVAKAVGIDSGTLAREAGLYVTADQLRALALREFEVGNHTYSHVSCRVLAGQEYYHEIRRNQRELESMIGRKVRVFSVPYGSIQDLTDKLVRHLRASGHEAAFLVESVANTASTDPYCLSRVSVCSTSDADLFSELELFPRLRSIRNRLFREPFPSRSAERMGLGASRRVQN